MVLLVPLAVSVALEPSQHNMVLPLLQAGLEMELPIDLVAPPNPLAGMEPLSSPAVSVVKILCLLSTAFPVLLTDLDLRVFHQPNMVPLEFPADLVVLVPCRLGLEPLVLQVDLKAQVLCQRSMVLHQRQGDSTFPNHSTLQTVDTLPQKGNTMPKKMIWL